MPSRFAKIDLAVQCYKKPESLVYTLMTLHRHSADHIDTVFIRDDSGEASGLDFLMDPELAARLAPWKIRASQSVKPSGWGGQRFTRRMSVWRSKRRLAWKIAMALKLWLQPSRLRDENDLRYQWAVNQTDKAHLMVIHDDVQFNGDIAAHHAALFAEDPDLAITGELGTCWHCGHSSICNPTMVMEGFRPPHWPLTPHARKPRAFPRLYQRNCRINEWCCTLDVAVAKSLSAEGIYFGNYEDGGDVGAYWLAEIARRGLGFADDFRTGDRLAFYHHGWQGHSGHSVWKDQGKGKSVYSAADVRDRLQAEFGYTMPA